MREIKLNDYRKVFTKFYTHKIEVLGVVVRITTPKTIRKYERKVVKHIYMKTHGKCFDLCETSEFGESSRTRITANPINLKLPKDKCASKYLHDVNYYIPNDPIVHFEEFNSIAIEKVSCEIFELFLKDSVKTGIEINSNGNLVEVNEIDFSSHIKKAIG